MGSVYEALPAEFGQFVLDAIPPNRRKELSRLLNIISLIALIIQRTWRSELAQPHNIQTYGPGRIRCLLDTGQGHLEIKQKK
jgi:hypothetical protein